MSLPVIYRDERYIAINKPSGLLVHRSEIDRHETRFALQLLRDQINQRVYPIHRLDRPTSGVLLFALDPDAARAMSAEFQAGRVQKQYLAVCRGWPQAEMLVDHPLKEQLDRIADRKANRDKPAQSAQTRFRTLATVELPVAVERYPASRYSLVQAEPLTGRKHQIRRHLKHIAHPIIGDVKHGKGVHNRFFRDHYGVDRLLLAATSLHFRQPFTGADVVVQAPLDEVFLSVIQQLEWQARLPPELLKGAVTE